MTILFDQKNNQWIDNLVELALSEQDAHAQEWLLIPPRDEEEELLNDATSEDEREPQILNFKKLSSPKPFEQVQSTLASGAVVAVDAGVVDLGDLASGGTIFAIRGAAVCYPPNGGTPFVCRYNTGSLVIDSKNIDPVFHYIGSRLGKEDLFVHLSKTPPYYMPRRGMGETSNQIQDRCRNFVERMIQEEAIAILKSYGGGILLIDGALPAGTFDTPEPYMRTLLSECRNAKIHVAAISKKTRITINGLPIPSLFTDVPEFIGYVPLSALLEEERNEDALSGQTIRSSQAVTVADEIYAVRFSFAPQGLTFRADVHPAWGNPPAKVLDNVYSRCQIYGGYPRPLIEAHQYSSFLYQDVQSLIVDVIVKMGVRPQEKPSMEVLFQPFGGKYK